MSNYVSPVMFPAKLVADAQEKPPIEITKIQDAIWYIQTYKLTRIASFFGNHVNQAVQSGVQSYAQNWIKPSGPRRPGEGVEDCEQGIMNAGLYEGGVTITFTQLLAGFLIGPNGISIRDLMRRTNCHVKSYTEDMPMGRAIRTRVFILQAEEEQSVLACLDVILGAVGRYKELAEGTYQGKYVNRIQKIKGFVFYYYPPPKNVVPNAAGIKGLPPSKQARVARTHLGFQSTGSYLAYLDSICHQIVRPQTDVGLTQFIRNALEMPSEDVDDIGCAHPGLYPGKIYQDVVPTAAGTTTIHQQLSLQTQDLEARANTGLARATHLRQTVQAAALEGSQVELFQSESSQIDILSAIPLEILQTAEALIMQNPQIASFFPGADVPQMKFELARSIMETYGMGLPPIHNTTDKQSIDPVVAAPPAARLGSIGSGLNEETTTSSTSSSVNNLLCRVPPQQMDFQVQLKKSPSKVEKKGEEMSPFRRTPFADKSKIISAPAGMPNVEKNTDVFNPVEMGLQSSILAQLSEIVGSEEKSSESLVQLSQALSSNSIFFNDYTAAASIQSQELPPPQ